MALGDFFNTYWLIIFGVLGALIGILIYYIRTPEGRFRKDLLMLSIPLVSDLVKKSSISKFARTMGIMLKTGIPMINAIELSTRVINNAVMEKSMAIVKNKVGEVSSCDILYTDDLNIKDKVIVTGSVDTSKKGVYKITYTVTNSRNETFSKVRTVVVE